MPKILDKDKEEVALTKKTIKHVAKGMMLKDAQKKTGQTQSRFSRIITRYAHIEDLYREAKKKGGISHQRRSGAELEEMATTIFSMMQEGTSLRKSCVSVGIPASSFLDWLRSEGNENYSERYDKVKVDMVEKRVDEILEELESPPRMIETVTESGNVTSRIDTGDVQLRRLKIDTKKWYVAKLAPKLYGDKTILSGDDENPIKTEVTQITRRIVRPGDIPGSSD